MKGEGGSPLLVVATCVRCCRGFEEPVLVGMAFGEGGEGGERWATCLAVLVVMWKVVGRGFGQNSHSRNLPVSLLGR